MTRTVYQPGKEQGGSGSVRDKIKKLAGKPQKDKYLTPKKPKFGQPKGGQTGSNHATKKGGIKGKNGGLRYGAMGGFAGVKRSDAVSLVNAGLKPEIASLRRERQKVRRETQAERQRAQRFYGQSQGDINHIYGETGEYINSQNQAINANYAGLTDRTAQAQQALMAHMEQSGATNQAAATSELDRLGIAAGGGMDRFSADQAFMEQQAQINGANNQANIAAMQSGASDVGNLLMGMNAGQRGSALGIASNTRDAALFEADVAKRTAVEELRAGMKDLRSQRPDLVRQMMEQMLQSRWGMYMDSQNLDLQEEQLDLQRAAQRAYAKNSGSYSSGSSYSSDYSSGGGGSPTGDGSAAGGKPTGDKPGGGSYSDLVNQVLQGKKPKPPRKPKPGKKK